MGDGLYKVSATIENTGRVATSITARGADTYPDSDVQVRLEGSGELSFQVGKGYQRIGHLRAHSGERDMEWVVRTDGSELTVEAFSTRGLYAEQTLSLSDRR